MLSLFLFLACGEEIVTEKEPESGEVLSDADGDGFLNNEDCDDSDSNVYPGAIEVCDGFDNNCDGQADEGILETFYADSDGDGFGSAILTTEACEVPEGYVSNGTDCNDLEPTAYPSAEEICDGIDNDCNQEIDENLAYEFYVDADGDGYGNEDEVVQDCDFRAGLSSIAGDCDDNDSSISPDREEVCDDIDNNCDGQIDEGVLTTFFVDSDEDGYGDPAQQQEGCEAPEGTVDNDDDCNDLETLAHPNFFEICDGVDNNCDGIIDEDTALDTVAFYADFDGDGHGDEDNVSYSCSLPPNHVESNDDCDDANNSIYPNANEICDGADNDCDGDVDEEATVSGVTYYIDSDGDGFGTPDVSMKACSLPNGYSENADDCDDGDDDNYLGADEVCDGVDNDCDTEVDNSPVDVITQYMDSDGDGFGNIESIVEDCSLLEGYVQLFGDCDDTNSTKSPVGIEVCDEEDNDCDGDTDEEAIDSTEYYVDNDEDGFGSLDVSMTACSLPEGYSENADDCDDENENRSPDVLEDCDGIDNDCDEDIDEEANEQGTLFYVDSDGDGFGTPDASMKACSLPNGYSENADDCDDGDDDNYLGADEVCDGVDNDCDTEVDNSPVDVITQYMDSDGDGFGNIESIVEDCSLLEGYVQLFGDCDDTNSTKSPVGIEVCDEEDNDCDGDTDEEAIDIKSYFADVDGDLQGDGSNSILSCFDQDGYVMNATDCDDNDNDIFIGAAVVEPSLCTRDLDNDGYGDKSVAGTDCDDSTDLISPDDEEVCDGIDNNCDDEIDEGVLTTFYIDSDLDGYGATTQSQVGCESPDGYVENNTDCDDTNQFAHSTSEAETCDGVDNNCNGQSDEGLIGVGDSCPASSCNEILTLNSSAETGAYFIDPDGSGIVQVTCDMDTDGGGWTPVFHLYHMSGLSEDNFISMFDHNLFTDEDWSFSSSNGLQSGITSLLEGESQGNIDIHRFDGLWNDVRMACNSSNDALSESHFAQIDNYTDTNGNYELLGATANGTSYSVNSGKNSFGLSTIYHDNETSTNNSGHYLCDVANSGSLGSTGTSQFSFCYTNFLSNDNSQDYGDSIVGVSFGTQYGSDGWSTGFSAECGNMGTGYLADQGTFWIWIR